MYHEKIVVNEKGDKVKIRVYFYISNDVGYYSISLSICTKGKRKFNELEFNSWEYRGLSTEDRRNFVNNKHLSIVTKDQILEAKTELWNKLKPF